MRRIKKRIPIIFFETYLTITVLLCLFGPWDFQLHNFLYTICLITLYQVSLYLGYSFSLRKHKMKTIEFQYSIPTKTMVLVVACINIPLLVMNLVRSLGMSDFSISKIYQSILYGLMNPGEAYHFKMTRSSVLLGGFGTFFNVIASPISVNILILLVIFYRDFGKKGKLITIISLLLKTLGYAALGTNKGIFDVAFIIIGVFFLHNINSGRQRRKIPKKIYCTTILIIVFLVAVFNYFLSNRGMGAAWNLGGSSIGGQVRLNRNSFWVTSLPYGVSRMIAMLTSYVSQGYYGFSLSTELRWIPTFGLGCNKFILDNLYDIGINIIEKTYNYRIETTFGWSRDVQWDSCYTWLANDFGHIGVALVMFVVGYIFASVYMEAVENNSGISKVMFCYICIFLFYVPANNQLFQTLDYEFSFLAALLIWLFLRGKRIKVSLASLDNRGFRGRGTFYGRQNKQ